MFKQRTVLLVLLVRQISAVIRPKVKEVRLYKEEWDKMDADAGNTSKPDRRILVAHIGGTEK